MAAAGGMSANDVEEDEVLLFPESYNANTTSQKPWDIRFDAGLQFVPSLPFLRLAFPDIEPDPKVIRLPSRLLRSKRGDLELAQARLYKLFQDCEWINRGALTELSADRPCSSSLFFRSQLDMFRFIDEQIELYLLLGAGDESERKRRRNAARRQALSVVFSAFRSFFAVWGRPAGMDYVVAHP